MAEDKFTFKFVLEVGDNVERTASLINEAGSFKDAFDCYKEFTGVYQNIGVVGKGQFFGEQLALVSSNSVVDEFGDTFRAGASGLDKTLGGLKAAVAVGELINKSSEGIASGLDYLTAGFDVASGLSTFVKFAPGVGQIVSGVLDAASSFIKIGQAIADPDATGKDVAGYALNGAAGILTVAAGICTLIPGAQVAVPFLLLASGICKLASLITANWDAVVGFFKDVGSWVANTFQQGVEAAKAFITQGIEIAKALFKAGKVLAVQALKGAIRTAVAVWNQILGTAVKALKMAVGIAVGAIKLGIAALKLTLAIGAAALKFGKALADAVKNWLKDIFKKKIDIAKDAQKWWKKIFKSIEKAVKQAIKEAEEREHSFVTIRYGEVRMFAGGGLPASGLPFVAREAGPELVGRLNGHTAVVNNHQIVEAVSRGVYGAFRSALCDSHSKSQAKAYVYLDGKQIAMAGQA